MRNRLAETGRAETDAHNESSDMTQGYYYVTFTLKVRGHLVQSKITTQISFVTFNEDDEAKQQKHQTQISLKK